MFQFLFQRWPVLPPRVHGYTNITPFSFDYFFLKYQHGCEESRLPKTFVIMYVESDNTVIWVIKTSLPVQCHVSYINNSIVAIPYHTNTFQCINSWLLLFQCKCKGCKSKTNWMSNFVVSTNIFSFFQLFIQYIGSSDSQWSFIINQISFLKLQMTLVEGSPKKILTVQSHPV